MQNTTLLDVSSFESPATSPARSMENPLRVFWRRKALVLFGMALCTVLAGAYFATATRRYRSTARIVVQQPGSRAPVGAQGESNHNNFLNTQRELLTSTPILALTLESPDVKNLDAFKRGDARLPKLRSMLDVALGSHDDVLSLSAETEKPEEAPLLVNAVINAYEAFQTEPKVSTSGKALAAIEERAKHAEQEAADKIAQMAALEDKYGVLSGSEQDSLASRRQKDLKDELSKARLESLKALSDYSEAIKAVRKDPGASVDKDREMALLESTSDESQLRTQLLQMQARMQEMRLHYLPNHPALSTAQQKIDHLAAAYAAAIDRRAGVSKQREDEIRSELDEQTRASIDLSAKTAQYLRLKEQADAARKSADQLETRIRALEAAHDAGSVDVQVMDPPQLNLEPSYPNKPLILSIALALGLLLGGCLAYVRDSMDDRLRSAEEAGQALGLKLLGVIPQMPSGISATVAARKIAIDPTGEVAEAYRAVRTALAFVDPRNRSRTIVITAPSAGDGKTTSAANLAIALAQAGKRVLLVDADLRNPTLHTIFNLRERTGLSTLLGGQGMLEQIIQPSGIENLDLLPCGPVPRNPAELLNSPMLSELLESLADRYDQVIIDSAPVTGLADSRIIAASCDQTILVLRAERSTQKGSAMARDGLSSVGAKLLGIIVNGMPGILEEHRNGGHDYENRVASRGQAPVENEDADVEPSLGQR